MGGLALFSRKYAHKIPFVVKLNHNELLTYPKKYDQIMFGSEAWNMGAIAVGATVYFGSAESDRQIIEVEHLKRLTVWVW
jgi:class I fructose-bisphosphate aldolase